MTLALGDDLGCKSGALVVDAGNGLSHHFGVGIKGTLGLLAEVAIYVVPVI